MSTPNTGRTAASDLEVAVWSVVVFVLAVMPWGVPLQGAAVGVALSFTRLRGNRLARWLVPCLGLTANAAAWALLIFGMSVGACEWETVDQDGNVQRGDCVQAVDALT